MKGQLAIRSLMAAYGSSKVLHDMNLEVNSGEIAVLLGAYGVGKTSTLRAISGLLSRQGCIEFDGRRIDKLSAEEIARLGVGHVPDGRGTFGALSVIENLQLGAIRRHDKVTIGDDMTRIFDYFPVLLRRSAQQAGTLSGGEQQMLAVGRALMARPTLLLLDDNSCALTL